MKHIISRVAIAVLLSSFVGLTAFAKTKTETLTLVNNLKVNGTTLSKGVYKVKFDEQKGELSIANSRGKVVASTNVRVEKRNQKAHEFMLRFEGKEDDAELVGVTFGGADHDLVVEGSAAHN